MAQSGRFGVGIIGAGSISTSYLENLTRYPDIEVHVVGDLDQDRARSQADAFGVPLAGSVDDVLSNDNVDLVVNLTIPAVHAEVSSAILHAGKHVWSEKPIGVSREEGAALIELAKSLGLRVGVAPDTLLGPGMQTTRQIIERGDIGVPLTAQTLMQTPGPQRGHPNPEFLFQPGAGPLFDFGPYYFSALVSILGPVSRVAAVGAQSVTRRSVGTGPLAGTEFDVNVPTHVAAIAQYEGGGVSQSVLSFDAQLQRQGFIEIYGSEGTLSIPDPNRFEGQIRIAHAPTHIGYVPDYEVEWADLPQTGVLTGRGLGVLDMARAIRAGRPHVASAELGAHVLDALVSIEESIATGDFVPVESSVAPVPLLPTVFDPFASTFDA